ncbi:MAG: hypothetical protein HY049_09545 [Acidobacteria bacterium]|nr:hypothetical protein [Acidobacteriota bacterium]
MALFLSILEVLFGVAGAALLLRGAWLLARGDLRHAIVHAGLATLSFALAIGFFLARGVFVGAA